MIMKRRCLISILELFLLVDKSPFSAADMCPYVHGFIYSDNVRFFSHIHGIFYRNPQFSVEWSVCCQIKYDFERITQRKFMVRMLVFLTRDISTGMCRINCNDSFGLN